MKLGSLFALQSLVKKACAFAPYRLAFVFSLMLLGSISSGLGILMIIPFMAAVGVDLGIQTSASANITNAIINAASSLGISLNIGWVLAIYLILVTFSALTVFLNSVLSTSFRSSFVVHLRAEMARSLYYAQWRYLNQNHMSDYMRLLTGQVQKASMSLYLLLSLLSSLVLASVYLALSLILSVELTLVALVCGLLLVALLWPVNTLIYKSGGLDLQASREIHRSIFENLASLKIIKSYVAEERYLQRLNSSNRQMEAQELRISKVSAFTRFVNTVGGAIIFALLFYGSIEWLDLPLANLLVILFVFARLMPQISSIQGNIQSLIHQAPSYQDLINTTAELSGWVENHESVQQAPNLKKKIELFDLEYQYTNQQHKVLTKLTATIFCNTTVAITGPSGAGKSTLADIIAGLVMPTGGIMKVDDQIINDNNQLSWRRNVAYVTQDVFLFHDTIRENLLWVLPLEEQHSLETLDQKIQSALKLAAADEFIQALPNGLNTVIGDRGVKLSGGERQRLALARALLSKSQVLILDEATSALDRHNELKIRDALRKLDGKLTILIIAHNETTIEHVEQRIQIETH